MMNIGIKRHARLLGVLWLGAAVCFCVSPVSQARVRRAPAGPGGGGQAAMLRPCMEGQEHRQFDFWLGEWDVTEQGRTVATSKISLIEGGCVVLEQYAQGDGYTGQSFNFYNPTLGKWRQAWVDRAGNISEFSGEYRDGAMRYEGVSYPRGQARVRRRMILFNLGPDKVRQLSYRSTDEGRTWQVNYDFLYVRRK